MKRRPRTDPWSIDDGYFDATGVWRVTSAATRRATVIAMGGDPDAPPPARPPVIVVRAGASAIVA